MTITAPRQRAQNPPAAPTPTPTGPVEPAAAPRPGPLPAPPPLSSSTVGPAVAFVMAATALLAFGFVAYLLAFSGLSEQRGQHALREQMFHELSQAVAPTGAVAAGQPVAVLTIPALNVRNLVVVQGTSSRNLMNGPGHVPASVLPGQSGISVVFGKRITYGAPFASLLSLQPGDIVTAVTGQGVSHYRVTSFGDSLHPAPNNSANELILVTAAKAWWPNAYVTVVADLSGTAQPAGPTGGQSTAAQQPLGRDVGSSLIPLAGWSQLLLLLSIAGTVAWFRLPRWPVLLCAGPLLVTLLWCVYESAAGLIPNLL